MAARAWRDRAAADRLHDVAVLVLERLADRPRFGIARAAADGLARNDEAAEILEEAPELRIAGGIGDAAMKREILVDRVLAALDARRRSASRQSTILRTCGGRRALGGKPGGLDLDAGAQLHDLEHLAQRRQLVEVDAERPARVLGDECADALAGDHQPLGAQRRHRLAHHRAADAGGGDHFLLGRQPRAGRQLAAGDVGGEPRRSARAVERARRRQRPDQPKACASPPCPILTPCEPQVII